MAKVTLHGKKILLPVVLNALKNLMPISPTTEDRDMPRSADHHAERCRELADILITPLREVASGEIVVPAREKLQRLYAKLLKQ